ncbi:unnamed protein product [Rhodiola kirilowii]
MGELRLQHWLVSESLPPSPTHPPPVSASPLFPTLPPPPLHSHSRSSSEAATHCRKIVWNVVSMATGEAPAEVTEFENPEIVKTFQENKVTSVYKDFIGSS